jgi:hypothetical protein
VVNTSKPGEDISIRVRGGSSIKADNEPLLVIGGFTTAGTPLIQLNKLILKKLFI